MDNINEKPVFQLVQPIHQLDKRKGGYYYLEISSEIVSQFPKQRATRLICKIEDKLSFGCGLNHLGDGNFFIILSTKNFKQLNKNLNDSVVFSIVEDPNPLGVEIPEVLEAMLEQNDDFKEQFSEMTDGKKRSLVYLIAKFKDIDKQIEAINKFFHSKGQIPNRKK
ncbi:MAG: DUF1905 domain-containing protein [Spirosomaceae bacterium]|jgi:hypothetical protein|nr:DUF1905 domain-containing protein [Spirosomataceae bacterium]